MLTQVIWLERILTWSPIPFLFSLLPPHTMFCSLGEGRCLDLPCPSPERLEFRRSPYTNSDNDNSLSLSIAFLSRIVPYFIYSSQQPSDDGIILKKQRFWERMPFLIKYILPSPNFLSSTAPVRTVPGSWSGRWDQRPGLVSMIGSMTCQEGFTLGWNTLVKCFLYAWAGR